MNFKPPLRVFVVDDCEEMVRVLRIYLGILGHEVHSAMNSLEALKALREESFDMLISDIQLPGLSGWDLMRLLGDRRPRYAVAMTPLDAIEDREASRQVGYRYHVVKPFEPMVLRSLLDEAAGEKLAAAVTQPQPAAV